MENYTIVAFKNILENESSSNHITMFKLISIPFPPYTGIKIRAGMTELSSNDLVWQSDIDQFRCNLPSEFASAFINVEQLISLHEDDGWKLFREQTDKSIFSSKA